MIGRGHEQIAGGQAACVQVPGPSPCVQGGDAFVDFGEKPYQLAVRLKGVHREPSIKSMKVVIGAYIDHSSRRCHKKAGESEFALNEG